MKWYKSYNMTTNKVGHYIGEEIDIDADKWVIPKEIFVVKADFLELSTKEKRSMLRMIIWWSIKQYFK
jgi:uncharacterized membrane protein YukC